MASTSSAPCSSTRSISCAPFLRAVIYLPAVKAYSKPRPVWFSLSSNLRWLYIESENDAPQKAFTDFRRHYCLTLRRLEPNAKWNEVEDTVRVLTMDGKPSSAVSGTFSRRLSLMCSSRTVQVIIKAEEQKRNAWANFSGNRIAPWRLLYRRTKEQLLDSRLTLAELECLFKWAEKVPKPPRSALSNERNEESGCRSEAVFIFESVNSISNLVQTLAVCARTCAPVVKESAELVGNVAKCVTVVGAAFQCVALLATVVDLSAEQKRGTDELPRIRSKLEESQGAVVRSMIPVLHPDWQVNEELVSQMFRVQEELVSILCDVEAQMMRRCITGFLKAGVLCKIEGAMKMLEDRVVDVVQSATIAENKGAIARLWNQVRKLKLEVNPGVAVMRERPPLSPYFVGRQGEMEYLKAMLDLHGSAAIMQMGGAGKTQLMIAFAERAERNKWITGGCHWVPANGNENDFIRRLRNFAEALTQEKLNSEEGENAGATLDVIKQNLRTLNSKWLLCLDNADDPSVNRLVGELCRIAEPGHTDGWVLVTSRQGGVPMWTGMEGGQKLKLEPLPVAHAILVLVRWKMVRLKTKVEDSKILMEMERLWVEDREEYEALRELAGDREKHGLHGLPLALAQAGSYISRNGVSFKEYVQFYKQVPRIRK